MSNSVLQQLHFLMVGFNAKKIQVESAQQLGLKVSLLISRAKYEPAFEAMFQQVVVVDDIYNWPLVEKALHQFTKIDVVLTRSEDHINVVGAINQHLHLAGIDYQTARNFCNKYLMKEKWLAAGVPCARGICLDDHQDLDLFLQQHQFPLMLKKTSAAHSNFVIRVTSLADLLDKWQYLKNNVQDEVVSKTMAGFKQTKRACQFVLEETLSGRELTVDTFVLNDRYLHTPICEYVMADELNVEDTYLPIRTMPIVLTQAQSDLVYQVVEKALRALGAKNCVCHTEVFFDEQKNYCAVIETTARGGGNRAEMTLATTGFDYSLAVFQVAAGLEPPSIPAPQRAISVVEYFAKQKGYFQDLNLDFLSQNPAVTNIQLKYKPGQLVEKAKFGGKPIISFFVKKNTALESQALAKELFKKIQTTIKIDYLE